MVGNYNLKLRENVKSEVKILMEMLKIMEWVRLPKSNV